MANEVPTGAPEQSAAVPTKNLLAELQAEMPPTFENAHMAPYVLPAGETVMQALQKNLKNIDHNSPEVKDKNTAGIEAIIRNAQNVNWTPQFTAMVEKNLAAANLQVLPGDTIDVVGGKMVVTPDPKSGADRIPQGVDLFKN